MRRIPPTGSLRSLQTRSRPAIATIVAAFLIAAVGGEQVLKHFYHCPSHRERLTDVAFTAGHRASFLAFLVKRTMTSRARLMKRIHQRELLAIFLHLMAFHARLSLPAPVIHSFTTLVFISVVTFRAIGISVGMLFVGELHRRSLKPLESILVIDVNNVFLSPHPVVKRYKQCCEQQTRQEDDQPPPHNSVSSPNNLDRP